MIVTALRPVGRKWSTLSFSSTLYLAPILDLLLVEVPEGWHAELRLGLQEALVNAVKHGNGLDPAKQVVVNFSVVSRQYWWVVADQGDGTATIPSTAEWDHCTSDLMLECSRGLYIMHQIFDRVDWNPAAHQLRLCKHIERRRPPLVS